jgi:hypothetical protein
MNSSKTDVNIFFSSRNLLQLEALLDEADAGEEAAGMKRAVCLFVTSCWFPAVCVILLLCIPERLSL